MRLDTSFSCAGLPVVNLLASGVPTPSPLTKLVTDSDSIWLAGGSAINRWATDNPSVPIVNLATSGAKIVDMMGRIATTMEHAGSHVLFGAGANDLMLYGSAQEFADAMFALVAAGRAINSSTVFGVFGIRPVDEATLGAGYTGFNVRRHEVMAIYRSGVGTLIDFYMPIGEQPTMTDAAGSNTSLFGDGLHQTTACQLLERPVVDAVIDSILHEKTGNNPDAFVLNDVSGAALSTRYEASVLVTGLGLGHSATASMAGSGDMARGHGSFGTSSFAVMNGDYVTRGITSSGSAETEVAAPLTIGSRSDTLNVTTSAPSIVRADELGLWLEASDLSTLFQTISATSPVTADGEVVGTWIDKSGNGFHLTAPGNTSVRPIYHFDGTIHWIEFDGVDDVLRRLAALDLYNAGGYTLVLSGSGNPGTGRYLVSEGNSSGSGAVLRPIGSHSVTSSNASAHYRNAAGAEKIVNNLVTLNGAWDNADHVYIEVDDGSTLRSWRDLVEGTPRPYARDTAFTLDRFALGALWRASASGWFAGRVRKVGVWPGVVFNATERAQAQAYFEAP